MQKYRQIKKFIRESALFSDEYKAFCEENKNCVGTCAKRDTRTGISIKKSAQMGDCYS